MIPYSSDSLYTLLTVVSPTENKGVLLRKNCGKKWVVGMSNEQKEIEQKLQNLKQQQKIQRGTADWLLWKKKQASAIYKIVLQITIALQNEKK